MMWPAFVTSLSLACLLAPLVGHAQQQAKLLNPFAGDAAALKEGRRLWFFLGCSSCHGPMGGGGMGGTPVLDDTWRFGSDDETLYKLIKGQIPAQTMQGYPAVPDEQVWQMISFVRTLYKGDPAVVDWALGPPPQAAPTAAPSSPAPPVSTPPTDGDGVKTPVPSRRLGAKADDGVQATQAVYDAQCSMCHGPAGAGDGPLALTLKDEPSNWKAGGGGLKGLSDQEIFDVIANGGMSIGRSTSMPASPKLSAPEVWSLVGHVKGLVGDLEVAVTQPMSPPQPSSVPAERLKWGSALDWAIVMTVGVSVLILVCILWSLIAYRGRQTEGNALWLHLLSLGVFPLILLPVGNFAVLEYAKEDRFCGSCHLTMKPYIDDLRDGRSRSLAARHFQHRSARGAECYSCHANYGVHGTFEAKLRGLQDVYKYVTRTYELPLRMRAPYENALCLKCHDEAKRYITAWDGIHLKLAEQLRTGGLRCVGCHKLAHDLPMPEQVARPEEAD